jgi:hypothetical protein
MSIDKGMRQRLFNLRRIKSLGGISLKAQYKIRVFNKIVSFLTIQPGMLRLHRQMLRLRIPAHFNKIKVYI